MLIKGFKDFKVSVIDAFVFEFIYESLKGAASSPLIVESNNSTIIYYYE